MKSHLTSDFIKCFRKIPERARRLARKNYIIWKENPYHPSLQFKKVGKRLPAYSVRIGIGWRALGVKENDTVVWFWIGSHEDYNILTQNL